MMSPPRLREIALFCLPALLLGLALRIALCRDMPLAFISPDTNEFLGSRILGGSRTFLPELLYRLPGKLHWPMLPAIAVFQHLLGLVLVFASGVLAAQWLREWRLWIIPLTCLIAVQPTLLWYEHFALPDSTFTLATVLACLAGGKFYRERNLRSGALLATALVVVAGARQEGFAFGLFGVALVARVYWGNWRRFRVVVPLALVLAVGVAKVTRTSQGGFMLLTSLIHWAPDKLWTEPDFSARVVALRDRFQPQWPAYPDKHNPSRKIILQEVEEYLLTERHTDPKQLDRNIDTLCKRLAIEIAARNFWRLPGLAFSKFRAMHLEEPAPGFGAGWAHEKHLLMFFGKPGGKLPKEHELMQFYLGRKFDSRAELEQELPRLYRILPGDWLTAFQKRFYKIEYAGAILPEVRIEPQTLPALPLLYLFSFAGVALVFVREGRALSDKQLWLLMLLLQAFAVCLTGSLRSRYRLSFEPWFLLGAFCFCDFAVYSIRRLLSPKEVQHPEAEARVSPDRPSSGRDRI